MRALAFAVACLVALALPSGAWAEGDGGGASNWCDESLETLENDVCYSPGAQPEGDGKRTLVVFLHGLVDGGTTWHNRSAGLPRNGISQIEIDPGNPARAYIANYGTSGGRVYRTADFGQTWPGISGALPSGVAGRALAVDFVYNPPVVYLGSGSGVYLSLDDGDEWIKDDASLPNVNVGSLSIHRAARTITVGTYGRGAWRAPLAVPPPCIADYNRDGGVDGADVEAFFLDWQNGNADADVNQDGGVDGGDVEAFFLAWESGAC